MTWFAIANKLREKKRLPYWLRWLAIDYVSWIVCATSMHRKAIRTAKQEGKTPSLVPSTPVTIPLQPLTPKHSAEYSNHSYVERDSLPTTNLGKAPLLLSKSQQSLRPSTAPLPNPTDTSITPTIWVRRPLSKSRSVTANGPEARKTHSSLRKSHQSIDPSLTKSQESLYAIHILNRLVFSHVSFHCIYDQYVHLVFLCSNCENQTVRS